MSGAKWGSIGTVGTEPGFTFACSGWTGRRVDVSELNMGSADLSFPKCPLGPLSWKIYFPAK